LSARQAFEGSARKYAYLLYRFENLDGEGWTSIRTPSAPGEEDAFEHDGHAMVAVFLERPLVFRE